MEKLRDYNLMGGDILSSKMEERIERKLELMAQDFAERHYEVGESLTEASIGIANTLSAYVACVASKRIEGLTTSLVRWNKVLAIATTMLAFATVALCFITVFYP